MGQRSGSTVDRLPDLGCACANIRRAARLVTQLYSYEMGGTLEPAQFSLLSALQRQPGASQALLGRALGLDKTTLSRNLRLLERNGWVVEAPPEEDLRQRGFRLSAAGRKMLAKTQPGWARAQARFRAALAPGEWERLMKAVDRVTGVAWAAQPAAGRE